jgi:hypothetical protein
MPPKQNIPFKKAQQFAKTRDKNKTINQFQNCRSKDKYRRIRKSQTKIDQIQIVNDR